MVRTDLVALRRLRVCFFGFVAVTAATFTADLAEARHYRHHHYLRHARVQSEDSYSPAFSSIIVDVNSGATLSPSCLAHKDHDALSFVRAFGRRQNEARYRTTGIGARRQPGPHQTGIAARSDHSG